MEFSNNIKNLREDNDYTQSYIAKILNVKRERYSKWENGYNEIPLNQLINLSNFYQVEVSFLLGLSKNKRLTKIPEFNMKKLGKRLKEIRLKHSELQKDVAKVLKCSINVISNYENGIRIIPTYKLLYFCDYYNVSIDKILS